METIYTYLHISDLHFSTEDDDSYLETFLYGSNGPGGLAEANSYNTGGLSWILKQHKKPLDCIVFTGDLSFQGNFESEVREKIIDKLQDVYNCAGLSEEGGYLHRLFYCPGNHDLLRDAIGGNKKRRIRRVDILSKTKLTSQKKGFFQYHNEEEREVLTKDTFSLFYSLMEELTGRESNEENKYYAEVFRIPSPSDFPDLVFFSYNTALLAGELYNPDDVLREELRKAYDEFVIAHTKLDTKTALDAYKKYHTLFQKINQKIAKDDGELYIANQQDINKLLQDNLNRPTIIIQFGHHPLDFLCDKSRGIIQFIGNRYRAQTYLCGHAHKAEEKTDYKSTGSGKAREIKQFCVGGVFLDKSKYNRLSFGVGEIVVDDDKKYRHHYTLYIYEPGFLSDDDWVKIETNYLISPIDPNTLPKKHTGSAVYSNPDEYSKSKENLKERRITQDTLEVKSNVLVPIIKNETIDVSTST